MVLVLVYYFDKIRNLTLLSFYIFHILLTAVKKMKSKLHYCVVFYFWFIWIYGNLKTQQIFQEQYAWILCILQLSTIYLTLLLDSGIWRLKNSSCLYWMLSFVKGTREIPVYFKVRSAVIGECIESFANSQRYWGSMP